MSQSPTSTTLPEGHRKHQHPAGLRTLMELFDVGPMIALSSIIASGAIVILAVFLFIHSAPPTTLTITSGPEGSVFQKNALKYAKILEKNGVKLKVLTSNGSLENLARLEDPKSHVDVGIVQGGITGPSGSSTDNLISLGGISYQPLLVFYRGKPLELLSELEGKKIAIGPQGSGTRNFALTILAANGIKEGGTTQLLDLEAEQASKELLNRTIDAAFIMSESASTDILHNLMHSDEVRLLSFKQANAYSRKIDYLSMLELPEGAIDFGKDLPAHDVSLVGPMVELVAVKGLHPALSDLLLEAAVEVHNRPGVFQKRGDFPVPVEHAIHLSDDAVRFYKSGKSFLYRYLPFWIASLSNRILVVFVPTLLILIPALRSIPGFFRWKFQSKIHRRYRDLLSLEHKILLQSKPVAGEDLKAEFDHIESAVNKMKIPAAFADQFYGLRGHIDYVRGLVERRQS